MFFECWTNIIFWLMGEKKYVFFLEKKSFLQSFSRRYEGGGGGAGGQNGGERGASGNLKSLFLPSLRPRSLGKKAFAAKPGTAEEESDRAAMSGEGF